MEQIIFIAITTAVLTYELTTLITTIMYYQDDNEQYAVSLRIKAPTGEIRHIRRYVTYQQEIELMQKLRETDNNGYTLLNIDKL